MNKGSENSRSSASKSVANVAHCGYAYVEPVKTTVTYQGNGGRGSGSYENTYQVSFGDKQTGSYGRATAKEVASAGEFQWKNGTSGTRSEYKESSTVRIGDRSGYTEVYNEQRVRNVSYNNCSGGQNLRGCGDNGGNYGGYGYGGNQNLVSYDNGDEGENGGYSYGGAGSYDLISYDNGDEGEYGDGYEYGYDSDF